MCHNFICVSIDYYKINSYYDVHIISRYYLYIIQCDKDFVSHKY